MKTTHTKMTYNEIYDAVSDICNSIYNLKKNEQIPSGVADALRNEFLHIEKIMTWLTLEKIIKEQ